ncbi:helix-turn-helix domain-containing protein [Streptomyces sp. NPDC052016]|uniref:helix-turn-helix domain-containing protein n=1 Tax=Streptomyces sp. NPDC052016 TaxID=3365680 RepID=UPI0037D11729
MTDQDRARAALLQRASTRSTRTDAARNHDAIVAAAREEFAENGDDVSLKAIARRAGTGIATLYRRFPSRAVSCRPSYADDVADTVDALCRTAGGGPAGETARPAAVAGAGAVTRDGALREVFTTGSPTLEPSREVLGEAVAQLLAGAGVRLSSCRGMEADPLLRNVVTVAGSPFLSYAEPGAPQPSCWTVYGRAARRAVDRRTAGRSCLPRPGRRSDPAVVWKTTRCVRTHRVPSERSGPGSLCVGVTARVGVGAGARNSVPRKLPRRVRTATVAQAVSSRV